jgi:hypothetical protein
MEKVRETAPRGAVGLIINTGPGWQNGNPGQTDVDGRFTIADVESWQYTVAADRQGYLHSTANLSPEPGRFLIETDKGAAASIGARGSK